MRYVRTLPDDYVPARSLPLRADGEDLSALRRLGVPLVNGGGIIGCPAWAKELVDAWPLHPRGSYDGLEALDPMMIDYDHDTLKRVISYVLKTDQHDFAMAAVAVARLEGEDGVRRMLGILPPKNGE